MSLVDDVIATAHAQLGKPYVLGTEGPSTFDCSGLVWYCFDQNSAGALIGGSRRRAAGYTRWAADNGQFTRDFRRAERGDLLVYEHPVGHVGLYLGGSEIISALVPPYGVKQTKYNRISVPFYGVILVDYGAGRSSTDDASDTVGDEPDSILPADPDWDSEAIELPRGRAIFHIDFEDRPRRAFGGHDVVNKITRRRPTQPVGTTEPGSSVALTPYSAQKEDGAGPYDGGLSGWTSIASSFAFAAILSGHTEDVDCGVYHNLPWPFSDCGVGVGPKVGRFTEEIWLAFTASWADDEVGAVFDLDTSGLSVTGYAVGSSLIIGTATATPTDIGQFTPIGSVPAGGHESVFLPRGLLPAGTCYIVIAPGWTNAIRGDLMICPGQPDVAGRVASVGDNTTGPKPYTLTTQIVSGSGALTPWVSGDGDVDGTNATFTLPDWNGRGVPEVRVGAAVLAAGEFTYDGGALTVTLNSPPPADMAGQVAFRYISA